VVHIFICNLQHQHIQHEIHNLVYKDRRFMKVGRMLISKETQIDVKIL